MATKTEERMRQLLEEYLDLKQQRQNKEITNHIYSIFLWGVIFGTLISYMSLMPLILGTSLGYVLSKKQWFLMDQWMVGWFEWIKAGQMYFKSNDTKIK